MLVIPLLIDFFYFDFIRFDFSLYILSSVNKVLYLKVAEIICEISVLMVTVFFAG